MKGRNIYTPPSVLSEIEKIKKDKCLKGKGSIAKASRAMAEYSEVGRRLEKMMGDVSLGLLPLPKRKSKRQR